MYTKDVEMCILNETDKIDEVLGWLVDNLFVIEDHLVSKTPYIHFHMRRQDKILKGQVCSHSIPMTSDVAITVGQASEQREVLIVA